jgi:hypothetical protein
LFFGIWDGFVAKMPMGDLYALELFQFLTLKKEKEKSNGRMKICHDNGKKSLGNLEIHTLNMQKRTL